MVVPTSDLYVKTDVSPEKTMSEVDAILDKLGITERQLIDHGEQNTYFEFIIRRTNKEPLKIRIAIPHIEKNVGHGSNRTTEYHKERAFRFFFHYLKALLSAKEAEMKSIEEIFMAHIVVPTANGEMTLGEQLNITVNNGALPALAGFDIVPTDLPKTEDQELLSLLG